VFDPSAVFESHSAMDPLAVVELKVLIAFAWAFELHSAPCGTYPVGSTGESARLADIERSIADPSQFAKFLELFEAERIKWSTKGDPKSKLLAASFVKSSSFWNGVNAGKGIFCD
jgi:hypothetical protein